MDAEDWAFLRKFCLIALAITILLAAIIMYFHSTAEPVTPSTASRTSRVIASESGNSIALVESTTLDQQRAAVVRASAINSQTNTSGDSTRSDMFTVFLIVCMLSGVGFYMARGGRLGYMRQPWQIF